MIILEEAVGDRGGMSPIEALAMVRSFGVNTGEDAESIVRASRDGR